ncbi:hypothetical protein DFO66_11290 [Brevibacterium sanguinis]|uniref:Uncharacterized protein n=3 Tax=Brevibacteriaceae TaxID=85019 RepID=A0A366IE53_9MICO|nr:hypothetical protein DFO66_11290 [Brevibacterium sanguinis]RBP69469.1 hypothetical protein DFO65_1123 [Brevibacterium celere]
MVPLLYTSLGAAGSSIVGAVSMSVGLVALLLGIAGLLLVKGTSWTRRIVGGAVFAVTSIYALVVPMLIPGLLYGSTFDVEFAVRAQQIVQVVNSIVIVSGVLIAWNVTRNRKWWLHLIAVGAAIVSAGIVVLTQFAFTTIHVLYPAMVPVTQILSLLLVFAALGLLHLLGSRPGAAVAVSASDPGAPAATRFGPG